MLRNLLGDARRKDVDAANLHRAVAPPAEPESSIALPDQFIHRRHLRTIAGWKNPAKSRFLPAPLIKKGERVAWNIAPADQPMLRRAVDFPLGAKTGLPDFGGELRRHRLAEKHP